MKTQTKSNFFSRLTRSVGVVSTGGMLGYAASIFLMLPVPQTMLVAVGLVGGALVAKATSKKK